MKTSKIISILKLNDNELDKAVKIRNTRFDRKCVYTDAEYAVARKLLNRGYSYNYVSKDTGISRHALRYHFDRDYRIAYNSHRSGKHYGVTHLSKANRVAYKRDLVAKGLVY